MKQITPDCTTKIGTMFIILVVLILFSVANSHNEKCLDWLFGGGGTPERFI